MANYIKISNTKRNRKYELQEIINAILYLVKTGCQWRMLPGDFAPKKTVYYYFSVWKKGEIFETIHEALMEKVRVMKGSKEEPTAGIINA